MTQLSLCFDQRAQETSREAHGRMTRSGARAAQVEFVAALVAQYPGRTSRDLSALTDGLNEYQIARRLVDLKHEGRVRKGEPTISKTGYLGVTWWPSDYNSKKERNEHV